MPDSDNIIRIESYAPLPSQVVFHSSSSRNKLFGGAMGGGKTRTLCEEVNKQMILFDGNRGLMLRKTLADFKLSTYLILVEQVLRKYLDSGAVTENKSERFFRYWNGSVLYYGGLDVGESEKKKYFSAEYGVVAVDEAREITETEFKDLGTRLRHKLPSGIHPPFYMLLASNPSQGWLKNRFISGAQEDYLFVPALPRDNIHNPEDYEKQLYSLFHGDENFIKAYIEGSWDAVGSIDDLLLQSDLNPLLDINIPAVYDKRLTSLDVARFGDDTTQIYNFENSKIKSQENYGKKDLMETVGRVLYNRERNKSRMIVVSQNGMDAGVYDRLREINGEISEPFELLDMDFSVTSSQPDRFCNLRAEIYWYAREQIKNRAVSIPKDDVGLQGQLCAIKYKFKGGPKGTRILIEAKEDIKKRLGFSPDKADAWVIGVWAMQFCPYDKDKPTWKDRYKPEKMSGSAMSA